MAATASRTRRLRFERIVRLLERPRLDVALAIIAVCLASPSLFTGFHLDDFVGRYIHSNLEGAERLRELYYGGYGLANGVPADNLWQVEAGHAPWWIKDDLLMALFRPISLATHILDYRLWPDSAVLQHAHSLLWFGLLVFLAARMYRSALGLSVGGFAGLLFALDYTHGFNAGYITNRHTLVSATFGVLSLHAYFRFRTLEDRRQWFGSVLLYVVALCSSESSVCIAAYVFSHALLVEEGSLVRRAGLVLPHAIVTVCWRVLYDMAGYGAQGSGLYIDIGREPLRFLGAYAERAPVLLLGQFFSPPPDFYPFAPMPVSALILVGAIVFVVLLVIVFSPLVRRDRMARFWALGMVLCLVPASALQPHSRQLMFASVGAAALIAQLWDLHAHRVVGTKLQVEGKFSRAATSFLLFVHLVFSPLSLPIEACAPALATPLHETVQDLGDIAGRDVVFVSSPDYFAVRLAQLTRRLKREPLPKRWRALSFGPQALQIQRLDEETLRVKYEGGILRHDLLELFRDRRSPMPVGSRVELEGLTIEVLQNTNDGRVATAEFRFDRPLEDQQFRFLAWNGAGYSTWDPPPVGEQSTVPAATFGHLVE